MEPAYAACGSFDLFVDCAHALPTVQKVCVAKKTMHLIERTTIPRTRRARHDTHTMAAGSEVQDVRVVGPVEVFIFLSIQYRLIL